MKSRPELRLIPKLRRYTHQGNLGPFLGGGVGSIALCLLFIHPRAPNLISLRSCVCFLTGFLDFICVSGSLSPSGGGLLAGLFSGLPRSRRYLTFNNEWTSPRILEATE